MVSTSLRQPRGLLLAVLLIAVAAANTDTQIKELLLAGDKLLLQGRSSYHEAVAKYTQAILLDPKNPKSLFRRAELYSMMKDNTKSLEDLKTLLAIEPHHKQGLTLRGKMYAAQGEFLLAADDYDKLYLFYKNQGNSKDTKKFEDAWNNAWHLRQQGNAWNNIEHLLKQEGLTLEQRVDANRQCVVLLKDILAKYAKDSMELHFRRAECASVAGDQRELSDELKYIMKREPSNLRAAVLNAKSLRSLGALDQAKAEVRRCLALDPEYPPCAKLHKLFKSYQKQTEIVEQFQREHNWKKLVEAIEASFQLDDNPPNLYQLWRWKCEAYVNLRDVKIGIDTCNTALKLENEESNPQVWGVFLHRADLHILNDDLDAAEKDIKKAKELSQDHKVNEYLHKLENLRRAAARKDYYKILGVKKTASNEEIRRAYRKLARDLHPDVMLSKDISDEEREKNDQRFRDMNEAKDILLDEEKRRRYDAGEDLSKPAGQQQPHHGFHHFHHGGGFPGGGFPGGGGGGGGFNFHFG